MVKRKKKATGAARMRELDYLPVQVWFKREVLNVMCKIANRQGHPIARWIRMAACTAAIRQSRRKRKA